MKTLKEKSKKLSTYIYESMGDIRGYPDLDLIKIEDVKEWLTQKRQEIINKTGLPNPYVWTIDELLEELQEE